MSDRRKCEAEFRAILLALVEWRLKWHGHFPRFGGVLLHVDQIMSDFRYVLRSLPTHWWESDQTYLESERALDQRLDCPAGRLAAA